VVDNELRRTLDTALATLRLTSTDPQIRLAAATELSKQPSESLIPLVRRVLTTEKNQTVRRALATVLAWVDIDSDDLSKRLGALKAIADAGDPAFKQKLELLVARNKDRQFLQQNAAIREAAANALSAIHWRETWTGFLSNLYYGLSLGSVLLLVSLGLAITFGLMRVINMAHGELLMIGAYSTYVVQQLFEKYLPRATELYLLAAIPVAFLVSAAIGMLIERFILRFLYGRPLETLLATWGVSLLLIQTVRRIFGAQNVAVANPHWLSGGLEVMPDFVLTYSRLAVILFSLLVVLYVWFVLRRTRLGLHVRAVTENRDMAASMGIPTRRVDLWTFGVGAGVAGLGGVALSQLGNVGPELGQGYIIDAFMVVVLGGVGNLAGTFAGALGLGIINKLMEPAIGAVLGKIAILAFIIIFIQRRPQGIFALKGRAAEVT
jgi:urea transport system permease protein